MASHEESLFEEVSVELKFTYESYCWHSGKGTGKGTRIHRESIGYS